MAGSTSHRLWLRLLGRQRRRGRRSWWGTGTSTSWCSTTCPRSPCRCWRARGAGVRSWATPRTSSARSCARSPREIAARGIKVVANAGGVNPQACRDALQKVLDELGVRLNVAVVLGDDISAQLDALRAAGVRDLESGGALPAAGRQRQCLSRRLADRAGARRRGRHRHHRPLRRQRHGAGAADPCLRLAARRLRQAGDGQSRRTHHRVRPAGHRRHLHRLARERCRLG